MTGYNTLTRWVPKQQIDQRAGKPRCIVCATEFLKGGSFVFAGGQALNLCKVDARQLGELSPLEREEAIRELVSRHAETDHRWRCAA